MVHDMLHMRGGHQVNWFFDGIPVVNTNIAANVAPLINPKNVEELEIERGGYSSEYGDRTYGFFNVVTPSGFERNNEAELIAVRGKFLFDRRSDQHRRPHPALRLLCEHRRQPFRAGPGHSGFAGDSRSDSGVGGFLSLLYNPNAKDQLRWIASLREDHYQIPNVQDDQAAGIRDLDLERDYFAGFHWTHSFADGVTFTLAPYLPLQQRPISSAGRRTLRSFWTTTAALELLRRPRGAAGAEEAAQCARRRRSVGPARQHFFRTDGESRRQRF